MDAHGRIVARDRKLKLMSQARWESQRRKWREAIINARRQISMDEFAPVANGNKIIIAVLAVGLVSGFLILLAVNIV
jgi:hypothetical protein